VKAIFTAAHGGPAPELRSTTSREQQRGTAKYWP